MIDLLTLTAFSMLLVDACRDISHGLPAAQRPATLDKALGDMEGTCSAIYLTLETLPEEARQALREKLAEIRVFAEEEPGEVEQRLMARKGAADEGTRRATQVRESAERLSQEHYGQGHRPQINAEAIEASVSRHELITTLLAIRAGARAFDAAETAVRSHRVRRPRVGQQAIDTWEHELSRLIFLNAGAYAMFARALRAFDDLEAKTLAATPRALPTSGDAPRTDPA